MWLALLLGDSLTKFPLQNNHPIYPFLDRRRKSTPLLPFRGQIKASLPLVSARVGQHSDVVLTKEEKLKNRPQAATPTKCKGLLVIDLCSPETRPAIDIKPLTTPKKLKLEGLLVIDLSSPPESPNSMSETKPTIDIKPPITPTKPKHPRPLVIDLCSVECSDKTLFRIL